MKLFQKLFFLLLSFIFFYQEYTFSQNIQNQTELFKKFSNLDPHQFSFIKDPDITTNSTLKLDASIRDLFLENLNNIPDFQKNLQEFILNSIEKDPTSPLGKEIRYWISNPEKQENTFYSFLLDYSILNKENLNSLEKIINEIKKIKIVIPSKWDKNQDFFIELIYLPKQNNKAYQEYQNMLTNIGSPEMLYFMELNQFLEKSLGHMIKSLHLHLHKDNEINMEAILKTGIGIFEITFEPVFLALNLKDPITKIYHDLILAYKKKFWNTFKKHIQDYLYSYQDINFSSNALVKDSINALLYKSIQKNRKSLNLIKIENTKQDLDSNPSTYFNKIIAFASRSENKILIMLERNHPDSYFKTIRELLRPIGSYTILGNPKEEIKHNGILPCSFIQFDSIKKLSIEKSDHPSKTTFNSALYIVLLIDTKYLKKNKLENNLFFSQVIFALHKIYIKFKDFNIKGSSNIMNNEKFPFQFFRFYNALENLKYFSFIKNIVGYNPIAQRKNQQTIILVKSDKEETPIGIGISVP